MIVDRFYYGTRERIIIDKYFKCWSKEIILIELNLEDLMEYARLFVKIECISLYKWTIYSIYWKIWNSLLLKVKFMTQSARGESEAKNHETKKASLVLAATSSHCRLPSSPSTSHLSIHMRWSHILSVPIWLHALPQLKAFINFVHDVWRYVPKSFAS